MLLDAYISPRIADLKTAFEKTLKQLSLGIEVRHLRAEGIYEVSFRNAETLTESPVVISFLDKGQTHYTAAKWSVVSVKLNTAVASTINLGSTGWYYLDHSVPNTGTYVRADLEQDVGRLPSFAVLTMLRTLLSDHGLVAQKNSPANVQGKRTLNVELVNCYRDLLEIVPASRHADIKCLRTVGGESVEFLGPDRKRCSVTFEGSRTAFELAGERIVRSGPWNDTGLSAEISRIFEPSKVFQRKGELLRPVTLQPEMNSSEPMNDILRRRIKTARQDARKAGVRETDKIRSFAGIAPKRFQNFERQFAEMGIVDFRPEFRPRSSEIYVDKFFTLCDEATGAFVGAIGLDNGQIKTVQFSKDCPSEAHPQVRTFIRHNFGVVPDSVFEPLIEELEPSPPPVERTQPVVDRLQYAYVRRPEFFVRPGFMGPTPPGDQTQDTSIEQDAGISAKF